MGPERRRKQHRKGKQEAAPAPAALETSTLSERDQAMLNLRGVMGVFFYWASHREIGGSSHWLGRQVTVDQGSGSTMNITMPELVAGVLALSMIVDTANPDSPARRDMTELGQPPTQERAPLAYSAVLDIILPPGQVHAILPFAYITQTAMDLLSDERIVTASVGKSQEDLVRHGQFALLYALNTPVGKEAFTLCDVDEQMKSAENPEEQHRLLNQYLSNALKNH